MHDSLTQEQLVELVSHYRPNAQVIQGMNQLNVLATVGATASGKTTTMRALTSMRPEFKFILDETSRLPRIGERQGIDFLFRNREEIIADAQKGDLVQVAIGPNGDLYCTRLQSYPPEGIGLITLVPAAVKEFRRLILGSFRAVYIVPATYELWQQWLAKQARDSSWTDGQMKDRLEEAKASYEFALADGGLRFILNDDTAHATQRLLQVANGEEPEGEDSAKAAAVANYTRMLEV